jgi:carbamoyltransferase
MNKADIMGIHYGHNATACLIQNGKVACCVSEERFNRIKNSTGFPFMAIEYIKKNFRPEIDCYVLTQKYFWGYEYLKKYNFQPMRHNFNYPENNGALSLKTMLKFRLFPNFFYDRYSEKIKKAIFEAEKNTKKITEMKDGFSDLLKTEKNKILYLDHHLSHALSTIFFLKNLSDKTLIFTLDGEGDGLSSSVNVLENKNIKTISQSNKNHSLGYLYQEVTAHLGMKPGEHEFKVMGLAPYAKKEYCEKITPIFEKILYLNKDGQFESKIPMPIVRHYLRDSLYPHRFDNVAGAIQKFTEDITIKWIKYWIKKTGIKNIGVAGGVFMNVKMNQKISELPEVASLSITPSAGDETTALGACFHGYRKYCEDRGINIDISPINNLYLGSEYSDKDIEKYLRENNCFYEFAIEKPENLNKAVAQLLAKNKVVARFSGRMEFGARALGNRSILSNPSSFENIRIINEMIKNRDFWMPFATSIIEEEKNEYIIDNNKTDSSFMAVTFQTTPRAEKELVAAIHPYDKTSRPQIVKKKINKDYYEIISEFKKITGIGGILNTSFNLHGEPNVESPADAIKTFAKSGLTHLTIGPYLISKK